MPSLNLIEPRVVASGDRFSQDEYRAMQKAFVNLADRWGLTDEQASILIGVNSTRTFSRWKQGQFGRFNIDTAARLSNLMGIHKALRLLFKDKVRGYGWIKRANTALGDATALEVMLNGQLTDLMRVRRYLDAQRAPW